MLTVSPTDHRLAVGDSFKAMKNSAIKDMIGLVFKSFSSGEEDSEVKAGLRTFRFYHLQDCCEYVRLVKVLGDPSLLAGLTITNATLDEDAVAPEGLSEEESKTTDDSCTWTSIKIECGPFSFTQVWLGESNGYYSESVYCSET